MPTACTATIALLSQGGAGGSLLTFLPLVMIMALAYVMFVMPQQQKEKRYREMVAGIKEKDHVVTVGGLYGVVTSVQRDQERVTLRVDDASGAKVRVGIWAISQVISDQPDSTTKK